MHPLLISQKPTQLKNSPITTPAFFFIANVTSAIP
nr:MAG TPA: hypothetical protein [Caudoviricetes sp.]